MLPRSVAVEGRGEIGEVRRGCRIKGGFCSLRLWGICGLWGRKGAKAETSGLLGKAGDSLSRPGKELS